MRSIRLMSHDENHAAIGVPSNSGAGKYAKKIHDEKGDTWEERGIGTEAKGDHADHKFIARAIQDRTDDIVKIFENEIELAIKDIKL